VATTNFTTLHLIYAHMTMTYLNW